MRVPKSEVFPLPVGPMISMAELTRTIREVGVLIATCLPSCENPVDARPEASGTERPRGLAFDVQRLRRAVHVVALLPRHLQPCSVFLPHEDAGLVAQDRQLPAQRVDLLHHRVGDGLEFLPHRALCALLLTVHTAASLSGVSRVISSVTCAAASSPG